MNTLPVDILFWILDQEKEVLAYANQHKVCKHWNKLIQKISNREGTPTGLNTKT